MLVFRARDTFMRRARTSIGKTHTSEITPETPPETITSTNNKTKTIITYRITEKRQIEVWWNRVHGCQQH